MYSVGNYVYVLKTLPIQMNGQGRPIFGLPGME